MTNEDREILISGLEALMRRVRDSARPRPERRKEYDHQKARVYYRAEELIDMIRRDAL